MHFMPEDEGYEEKLWPDGYKAVIKDKLRELIAAKLRSEETLKERYTKKPMRKSFPILKGSPIGLRICWSSVRKKAGMRPSMIS